MIKPLRLIYVLALSVALALQAGCDPSPGHLGPANEDAQRQLDPNSVPVSADPSPPAIAGGGVQDANGELDPLQSPHLIIGSFNIQSFGESKMSKPGVVGVLVDVVRRFDILAIQELRNKDQTVIPAFLKLINDDGSSYAAAVGPRQGYAIQGQQTQYFEQSVFIYDTNKVELIGPSYAAYDRYRIMHRPPFVGHFRCREVRAEQAFSFVLMNVHIDPDDTQVEFQALKEIISETYANHRGEDDFILLGDMNEEPEQYQKYQWMRNQRAMLPSELKTNTLGTRAYDNLVFDAGYTAEFRNQAGVMNLMDVYQLTMSQAKLVSDHFPVWGVFSGTEAPRGAITQSTGQAGVIR